MISGITLSTKASDIVYALYEGVAEDIAAAVGQLGGASCLKVFGGGANSPLWNQIIADVTGMKIRIPVTPEAAGAGAAMLAAQAAGQQLPALEVGRICEPGAMKTAYEEKYNKFRSIERKLWA